MLQPPAYQPPGELDLRIFAATVPHGHHLRRALSAVDFDRCRPLLAAAYDPSLGRPACEPPRLLKLEFLQYHDNLPDRQVIDQARYNMAFRLFLGLGLDSPLPDPSLLCYFRKRLGADRHQQLFDAAVAQARERGPVKDRLRPKDATHVLANLAVPTTIALAAQARERLPQALRVWDGPRAAGEVRRAGTIRTAAGLSGEERLPARVAHLRALLAWAEEADASSAPAAASAAQREPLRQALRLARKVLADRDGARGPGHLVSAHGQEARRSKRGDFFTGCPFGRGHGRRRPGRHGPERLARPRPRSPRRRDADRAGGAGAAKRRAGGLTGRGRPPRRGFTGFDPAGRAAGRGVRAAQGSGRGGTAHRRALHAGREGPGVDLPGGQTTDRRRRSRHDTGRQYSFSRPACAGCPLRGRCVARLPQGTGRVVIKNHHEKEYQAARAKARAEAYRAVRREHPAIERKPGEVARWHRGRWARYRGQSKVLLQGLLVGLVVNVKRMVALAAATGKARAELAATG